VVAVVVDSAMARAVLAALGLPCTPATFTPARDPPQAELSGLAYYQTDTYAPALRETSRWFEQAWSGAGSSPPH